MSKDTFTFKDLMAAPGFENETEAQAYLRYRAMKRRRINEGVENIKEFEAEVDEALTMSQRLAKGRQMKRFASRIKMGKSKASKRMAGPEVIKRRAQKSARMQMFKKLSKGKSPSEIPFAKRAELEKRLDKLAPRIARIAKKMIPQVRKLERERKRNK